MSEGTARLFVRGLGPSATENDIRSPLELAGLKVISVELATDQVTGGCRGFAWLTVEPHHSLSDCEILSAVVKAAPRLSFAPDDGRPRVAPTGVPDLPLAPA